VAPQLVKDFTAFYHKVVGYGGSVSEVSDLEI
jgi:hypothetical protein